MKIASGGGGGLLLVGSSVVCRQHTCPYLYVTMVYSEKYSGDRPAMAAERH